MKKSRLATPHPVGGPGRRAPHNRMMNYEENPNTSISLVWLPGKRNLLIFQDPGNAGQASQRANTFDCGDRGDRTDCVNVISQEAFTRLAENVLDLLEGRSH